MASKCKDVNKNRIKKFMLLFKQVDGKKIISQYKQSHVLIYAMFMGLFLGIDKKSLEILRLAVSNKMLKRFRKKYSRFIKDYKKTEARNNTAECNNIEEKRKIWFCWFQGIDRAPEVVKKCYESIKKNMPDREIVLITEDNYNKYVKFPDYIVKKIKSGIISKTHMSDLLRLELLTRYGGTWIDATVYCTERCKEYMLDSDLFVFQDLKPGLDGHCLCISSWFITAAKGNRILNLTLALLYEYWKHNDKLVDYYLIHIFFQLAIETYPSDWNKVIPVSNSTPHILLLRLFDNYDEEVWNAIKSQTCIHKLSYKFDKKKAESKGTYYKNIFG